MRTLVLCLLFVPAGVCAAGDTPDADVQRLADQIDALLKKHWADNGVTPAEPADDAEFMRRTWLDIAGRIPPAADVQDFLEDDSPDKRARLVDKLLNGPNYVMNFANVWRAVMMPEADSNFQTRFMLPGFESWLRTRLTEDVKYDALVREILTARLQGVSPFQVNNATPVAFYQAKETKPENLAAATSRMFLGIRIECAQCHDHPFDNWSQKDFWGYASFFAAMQRQRAPNNFLGQLQELFSRRTLTIPDSDEVVEATYLTGESPTIPSGTSARGTLADWVTSSENPYFARAAANRMWGHFFGVGIVDPVDDFSDSNPATHPELLDTLATELAAHEFDLKFLIRAITRSRAYQLSSRSAVADNPDEAAALFAQMSIKGLTGEQFYDSIAQAVGAFEEFNPNRNQFNQTPRGLFISDFSDSRSAPTERQKSVLQALSMMNGRLVGDATSLQRSITLAAIADYPLFTTEQRVESLFLATLSRQPTAYELERFSEYVEAEGAAGNRKALSDVFWALLNSNEFSSNH